jgi:hypothetical protein
VAEGVGDFGIAPGRPFEPGTEPPADATPGNDAEQPPLEIPADAGTFDLLVSEETVRALLTAQGSVVHGLAAIDKESDEWVWLQAELDAIVPPLTRIINRYDSLRRLAEAGDPLAVMIALGGYSRRSIETRAATRAALLATAEHEASEAGQARMVFLPDQPQ